MNQLNINLSKIKMANIEQKTNLLKSFPIYESILENSLYIRNPKDREKYSLVGLYLDCKKIFPSTESIPEEFKEIKRFVSNMDTRLKETGVSIETLTDMQSMHYGGSKN